MCKKCGSPTCLEDEILSKFGKCVTCPACQRPNMLRTECIQDNCGDQFTFTNSGQCERCEDFKVALPAGPGSLCRKCTLPGCDTERQIIAGDGSCETCASNKRPVRNKCVCSDANVK